MPDNNFLINEFKGKDFHKFLPVNMDAESLSKIATMLSKWKQNGLQDDERLIIEAFACFWARGLLTEQKAPLAKKLDVSEYGYLPVLIAMSELEFLVHQEIVSRSLSYCTYNPISVFDIDRLKRTYPEFLRSYLRSQFLGFLAEGDFFTAATSSISSYLEQ